MGQVVAFLIVGSGFSAILCGFVWLARRVRRRGNGGALMGPLDEIYHPAAYRFRHEVQVQDERLVPLPSADAQSRRDRKDYRAVV